jgi:hypothetical protein
MTISTQIIPQIDLSLVPQGTSIKIVGTDPTWNDIEIEVSHHDELTLLRLVQQIWSIDSDNYDILDLV